jgi:hypothetical protein
MFTFLMFSVGSATVAFCMAVRERRLKAVALAEEKRKTETDPHHMVMTLAKEGFIDGKALLEKSSSFVGKAQDEAEAEIVRINGVSSRR